jgi:hypothetical protein
MAHMGRHISDSGKIFNPAGDLEDFSKLTDQQLQEELQKANEAYTRILWRVDFGGSWTSRKNLTGPPATGSSISGVSWLIAGVKRLRLDLHSQIISRPQTMQVKFL